jgi:hypothetical protein
MGDELAVERGEVDGRGHARIVAPTCCDSGSFRKLQKQEKPDEYPVLGMLLKHLVNKNQHFLTACAVLVRGRRSWRARQGQNMARCRRISHAAFGFCHCPDFGAQRKTTGEIR